MRRGRATSGRRISSERRVAHYAGLGLMAFGSLVLLSGLFTFPAPGASASRAGVGVVLVVLGTFLRAIGSRGIAGSGVVLDPERARRDIEPWARMGGGIVKDALEEVGVAPAPPEPSPKEDFDAMLRKLHQLHADGILTEAEYEREKAAILDRI